MAPDGGAGWQPGATVAMLHRRAAAFVAVREFFAARGVLEVDTPLLGAATGTDPAIDSIATRDGRWLQTSPELHMKRLLAAGSGPIWQLTRAFRDEGSGRLHNPEFTILEWYRPGWCLEELVAETVDLVRALVPVGTVREVRLRDLIATACGIDPFAEPGRLADAARTFGASAALAADPAAATDFLYDRALGSGTADELLVIREFPVAGAALARVVEDRDGTPVAARFELALGGIELANGYVELTDAALMAARFEDDLARRRAAGQPAMPVDRRLLAALAAGLPDCAGVAVGFDRVLLAAVQQAEPARRWSLDDVLPFAAHRA